MGLSRAASVAAALLAVALLAGCTAKAATAPVSIGLAGRGVEITATPIPETAFTACSDKIAADKAAKAAAIAKAKAKAEGAARAARLAAAKRVVPVQAAGRSSSSRPQRLIHCSPCGRMIPYGSRRCPYCGKDPWDSFPD